RLGGAPRPRRGGPPAAAVRAPLLLFEQVSKWYGPVIGVNQVTLELRQGITGLVGPNGAGKTTLMRLATGQVRASLGRVTGDGHDAWRAEARRPLRYRPHPGALFQGLGGRQLRA